MVTTIADRTLVAFDTATGKEKWRTALGREPRGIAVSPDGTRALVAYLTTGTVDQVDLLETPQGRAHRAVDAARARRSRFSGSNGDSFARGAFTALFMGEHQAVVPFQRETPVQQIGGGERTGSYGGGFEPPITHQLAFLGIERRAHRADHRARSRSTSRARSRGTRRTTRSTSRAWAATRSSRSRTRRRSASPRASSASA